MKRTPNRSILTIAFVLVVMSIFVWHFNRRMGQIKHGTSPPAETTLVPAPKAPDTTAREDGTSVPGLPDAAEPILACFCSDWSPRCQQMGKVLESIRARFGPRLQVRVIDPSTQVELAKQFRIAELPTCIIFDASGNLVLRREGPMTEKELLSALEQLALDRQLDSSPQGHSQ